MALRVKNEIQRHASSCASHTLHEQAGTALTTRHTGSMQTGSEPAPARRTRRVVLLGSNWARPRRASQAQRSWTGLVAFRERPAPRVSARERSASLEAV